MTPQHRAAALAGLLAILPAAGAAADEVSDFYRGKTLNFVVGCIPSIYVGLGVAMLTGGFDNDPNPPPPEMGWVFSCMGATGMGFLWTIAVLQMLAGNWIRRRSHYRLCFVIACIQCIEVPKGTLLGVFTLLVLQRPSVKRSKPAPPRSLTTLVAT